MNSTVNTTMAWLAVGFLQVTASLAPVAGASDDPNASGPRTRQGRSVAVAFTVSFEIAFPGQTDRLSLIAEVPRSIPRCQTIKDLTFSHPPEKTWEVADIRYARFEFADPNEDITLEMKGEVEITRYDLATARRYGPPEPPVNFDPQDYLKPADKIEAESEAVVEAAAEIKGDDQIATVRKIHGFVVRRLKYEYDEVAHGALQAMERRRGDCDEYTALFVALCRAKKIPARWVTGYQLSWHNTPNHSWPQVYLDDHGWVPFDPTINHRPWINSARLLPNYFYVSFMRQDPLLHNKQLYGFRYFGDKPKISYNVTLDNISAPRFGQTKRRPL